MPRTARASVGGLWYHVLNRGNRRDVVFRKPRDYDAFVEAMADARRRLVVDLLGYFVSFRQACKNCPPHAGLGGRPMGVREANGSAWGGYGSLGGRSGARWPLVKRTAG